MIAKKRQFSVSSLILLMTATAVWFALSYGAAKWLIFVIIDLVAVFGISEVLVRNLPTAIRQLIRANSRRPDGTVSERRVRVERQVLGRLYWRIVALTAAVVAVNNVAFLLVDTTIFPLRVVANAAGAFQMSSEDWKKTLDDEAPQFDRWMGPKFSRDELATRKQFVWQMRYVVIAVVVAWGGAVFFTMKGLYLALLRRFHEQAKLRFDDYRQVDVSRQSMRHTQ
ncbi:MAG: hypothetical protein R3E01_00420 [Pirellulaceae bacterium]|nr:hypothetical protein [Planctomycetales bacterium]